MHSQLMQWSFLYTALAMIFSVHRYPLYTVHAVGFLSTLLMQREIHIGKLIECVSLFGGESVCLCVSFWGGDGGGEGW